MSTRYSNFLKGSASCVEFVLAGALLILHAWLGFWSSSTYSCTADELPHLAAGHSYWAYQAYQMQPENGNLPQRWMALPAVLQDRQPPDPTNPEWNNSNIWAVGYEYLYLSTNNPDMLLLDARLAALLWSLMTGVLIFFWSRSLFGSFAGLFSLAMFSFCPTYLANGPLLTSDTCGAFFLLASVGAFWRHLQRCTIGSLCLSVLCFGLCCVAKFNAPLLLPVDAALIGFAWARHRGSQPLKFFTEWKLQLPLGLVAHFLGALFIIWAFFGFGSGHGYESENHYYAWSDIIHRLGFKGQIIEKIKDLHIVPFDYLYGLTHVLCMAQKRGAFLNGEVSTTGWWYFFPYTFLVKTTMSTLLASAAALIILLFKNRKRQFGELVKSTVRGENYRYIPLVVFWLIFWLSALSLNLNIGHRHILPTYIPLFILCGGLISYAKEISRRFALSLGLLLVGTQSWESLSIAPDYLAFFNRFSGGANQGYKHLVDSSLDWGQSLPATQEWLDHHSTKSDKVFLAYFGTASTRHQLPRAGIILNLMAPRHPGDAVETTAGIYCISATLLQQSYLQPREWTLNLEREYQGLKNLAHQAYLNQNTKGRKPELIEAETKLLRTFETHRFRRLAGYLRNRKPDGNAGHSILIYRLDQGEINEALNGTMSEWTRGIERLQQTPAE